MDIVDIILDIIKAIFGIKKKDPEVKIVERNAEIKDAQIKVIINPHKPDTASSLRDGSF